MFDYFYANENEQYLFLQMPLMLIKEEQFKILTGDAKILYSLALNRTALSAKNGWLDEQGRVYIIYTQEEIMSDLNCWEQKATKSMKELRDIGLIKSVRRGLGKPNILYVMNFATSLKYQTKHQADVENPVESKRCENHISGDAQTTSQKMPEPHLKKCENHIGSILTFNNTDSTNINLKEINNSAVLNIPSSPIQSICPEKPKKENPDGIRYDTTPTQTLEPQKEQKKERFQNISRPNARRFEKPSAIRYNYNDVLEIVKSNIDYDYILMDDPNCEEMLNGVLHVIASTITSEWKSGYVNMGAERVPAELVRGVFFKLTKEEVEYFIENFKRQTEPVVKLTPYIRASLYRNHSTGDFYWTNRVHVDMPQLAGKKHMASKNGAI